MGREAVGDLHQRRVVSPVDRSTHKGDPQALTLVHHGPPLGLSLLVLLLARCMVVCGSCCRRILRRFVTGGSSGIQSLQYKRSVFLSQIPIVMTLVQALHVMGLIEYLNQEEGTHLLTL